MCSSNTQHAEASALAGPPQQPLATASTGCGAFAGTPHEGVPQAPAFVALVVALFS